jgi:trehalose 6-phosphate synthase
MNLVAKEFVVSQNPEDPGVLVLSRFAGAAEQMREALLVNPYDVEGTAAAIQLALTMSLEERRERHEALMRTMRRHDVHWWCDGFLDALAKTESEEKGTPWLRL